MKVTTVRLPESLHDSLESEAADEEMSVAEYIRAILRNRAEHTPPNTLAASAGDAPAEYATAETVADLRSRVDELEARLDDFEPELNQQPTAEQGGVLVNDDTPPLEVPAIPSSASDPYGNHVQTALEIVRRSDDHVPKRVILANVPDADIKEGSLWERHIQPALRESDAEHTRNKGWLWDDAEE